MFLWLFTVGCFVSLVIKWKYQHIYVGIDWQCKVFWRKPKKNSAHCLQMDFKPEKLSATIRKALLQWKCHDQLVESINWWNVFPNWWVRLVSTDPMGVLMRNLTLLLVRSGSSDPGYVLILFLLTNIVCWDEVWKMISGYWKSKQQFLRNRAIYVLGEVQGHGPSWPLTSPQTISHRSKPPSAGLSWDGRMSHRSLIVFWPKNVSNIQSLREGLSLVILLQ